MRRSALSALTVVFASTMLAGCAQGDPATPTTSADAGETGTGDSTALADSAWEQFVSDDTSVSFEYPSIWSVNDYTTSSDAPGQISIAINDADGADLALFQSNWTQGEDGVPVLCETTVPVTVLDSEAMKSLPASDGAPGQVNPQFAFRALELPDATVATLGITTQDLTSTEKVCQITNGSTVEAGATITTYAFADREGAYERDFGYSSPLVPSFDSIDAAKKFMDTPEYAALKRMFTSLELTVS